jgi:hypothetical protein
MDAVQAMISSLYTNFVLRDFVGKVVPGGLVLFSMAILFARPGKIVEFVFGPSIARLLFLIGISWTLMFGLQKVADWIEPLEQLQGVTDSAKIWDEDLARSCTTPGCHYALDLSEFRRNACPDDKLAFERFEAIKEACRNLLLAAMISIFPIGYYFLGLAHKYRSSLAWKDMSNLSFIWNIIALAIFIIFAFISVYALYLTANDHALREIAVVRVVHDQPCPPTARR